MILGSQSCGVGRCVQLVDETHLLMGSYEPRTESYVFISPVTFAPKGIMARGCFDVKSFLCDDDGNEFKRWKWIMQVERISE